MEDGGAFGAGEAPEEPRGADHNERQGGQDAEEEDDGPGYRVLQDPEVHREDENRGAPGGDDGSPDDGGQTAPAQGPVVGDLAGQGDQR